jgi:hypothetical protein
MNNHISFISINSKINNMELQQAIQTIKDELRTGGGLFDSWSYEVSASVREAAESVGVSLELSKQLGDKSAGIFLNRLVAHDFVEGDPVIEPVKTQFKEDEVIELPPPAVNEGDNDEINHPEVSVGEEQKTNQ